MNAAPLSVRELCESVRKGLRYDDSRLDRLLCLDGRRGLVEVQANTPWTTLAHTLLPEDGGARELRPSTIGQSVAWNEAGPDGRPCVAYLESLTLVSFEGHLRRVSRREHPEVFALAVGGHGAFGPLYSATLRVDSVQRALTDAQAPAAQVAAAPHGRPLQLLVPPHELDACMGEMRRRCALWRVPVQPLQVRRIRQENETFLRWAAREYLEVTLALGAPSTLGGVVRATQLRRSLIDVAIARGGSFPIACTPEATREQAQACYPQLASFLAEQRRLDPQGRWSSAWLRHQRGLLEAGRCAVRWSN